MNTLKQTNIKKENVACNLCGADDYFKFAGEKGFDIVKCRHCGLVYVNPRMSYENYRESLCKSYDVLASEFEQISKIKMDDKAVSAEEYDSLKKFESLRDLDEIRKRMKKAGGKHLLDAGCGQGYFLYYAQKNGFTVKGVEPSGTHIPHEKFEVDFVNKEFTDINAAGEEKYDVITFFDALEHTRDPKANIRKAYELLDEGGMLVIRVPNITYIKIKEAFVKTALKGKTYSTKHITNFGIYVPETHFYNFSQKTLTAMLRHAGFKNIQCRIMPSLPIGTGFRRTSVYLYHLFAQAVYALSLGCMNLGTSLQFYAYKE